MHRGCILGETKEKQAQRKVCGNTFRCVFYCEKGEHI